MKGKRFSACCFFVAAAGFFLAAMAGFSSGNSMSLMWFVLGCAQLTLGCTHYAQYKKELQEQETQKQMDSFKKKSKK